MRNARTIASNVSDKLDEIKMIHAGGSCPNIEDYHAANETFNVKTYILRETEEVDDETGEVNFYQSLIVMDTEGEKFKTSSAPFIRTFMEIVHDLEANAITIETIPINIFKGESIQFKGKHYYHACL